MSQKSVLGFLVLQSVILMQAGCSNYQPTELPSREPHPPGPGLLSGEKGYFEIDFDR